MQIIYSHREYAQPGARWPASRAPICAAPYPFARGRDYVRKYQMDNQHKKIKGYRDLSQAEIDLMNAIKTKGAELLELHAQVRASLHAQDHSLRVGLRAERTQESSDAFRAFRAAEPHRWADIAKTDIQTGLMALIRAVAQPTV